MDCLSYPLNSKEILKKKKAIKRELLQERTDFIPIKIAILEGSTTTEIKNILDLFLLKERLQPAFFESEYNQYWNESLFPSQEFLQFQ